MDELGKELDLRESRESLVHCVQILGMLGVELRRITERGLNIGVLRNGVVFYEGMIDEIKELGDWARDLAKHAKRYMDWMDKFGKSIVRGQEDALGLLHAAKEYHDELLVHGVFVEPLANDLLSRAMTFHFKATNYPGMYEVSPRKVALDGYVGGKIWRHNGIEVNCDIPERVMEVMAEAARLGPGSTVPIKSDVPKNVQADIRKAHQIIAEQAGSPLNWHVKSSLRNRNYAVTVHVGPFPPKKSGPKAKPKPKKKAKTTNKTKKPKK